MEGAGTPTVESHRSRPNFRAKERLWVEKKKSEGRKREGENPLGWIPRGLSTSLGGEWVEERMFRRALPEWGLGRFNLNDTLALTMIWGRSL